MSTLLAKIIDTKKDELRDVKAATPLSDVRGRCGDMPPVRGFASSLAAAEIPAVIAELKKASPVKGLLCPDFSVERLAECYAENGAAAISVLTEKNYFQGDLSFIKKAKAVCDLPALRKDFIFDPYQVYEARAAGADAMLLIAAALERNQIEDLAGLAHELGLDVLAEAHDADELIMLDGLGCDVIGVNNRNLKTGETDIRASIELSGGVPDCTCKISESGIKNSADVKRLVEAGYHGFLIGESLVVSDDPGGKLKSLRATGD